MQSDMSLVPHMTINDNAKSAIDFYKKAFGAEEIARYDAEDGKRLMHAHLKVNGHNLFLMDAFPERGSSMVPSTGIMLSYRSMMPTNGGIARSRPAPPFSPSSMTSSGATAGASSRIPLAINGRSARHRRSKRSLEAGGGGRAVLSRPSSRLKPGIPWIRAIPEALTHGRHLMYPGFRRHDG